MPESAYETVTPLRECPAGDVPGSAPTLTAPQDGEAPKHPARFSSGFVEVFADLLACHHEERARVLDPFAGVGGIHELREFGHDTVGVEIEAAWARQHSGTVVGDATALPFPDAAFDAVVTSPAYGNRMADNLPDRYTYRAYLGQPLLTNNGAGLQWGDKYRHLHARAWAEAVRVVRPNGLIVANVKDHFRARERQRVTRWHRDALLHLGCDLVEVRTVKVPSMSRGVNRELRMEFETIFAMRTPSMRSDT